MNLIETMVIILTIGFAVMFSGYVIINKIFYERRKDSKEAITLIGKLCEAASEMITGLTEKREIKKDKKEDDKLAKELKDLM